jgi:uncharacterized protein YjbI with pentapeptide repeats
MTKRENYIQKKFNSKEELTSFLIEGLTSGNYKSKKVTMSNFSFDFEIVIPLNYSLINVEGGHSNFLNNCEYNFTNCNFYKNTKIRNSTHELNFTKCNLQECIRIEGRDKNLTFKDCEIKNLDISESIIGSKNHNFGKLRIKSCDVYKTNFKNTTFYSLVDFYYSTFHHNVVYYKTDFFNILVLSASKFKENLLFTYTLLNDKVIMRSTIFEKGYDFSLAIIKGQLAIFDLHHTYKAYEAKERLIEEKEYEKAVSYQGIIPTQNQLETYRLLKVEFEKQQNIPESLKFKLFEKKTLKKVLKNKENTFKNFWDKVILFFNQVSNNHGTSYTRAFVFILLFGGFWFYLSLISTDSYEFSLNISEWKISDSFSYFWQFLLPTHKFNYMGDTVILTSKFYLFDFLGRIFVGYGIYQFIQAFRKFK